MPSLSEEPHPFVFRPALMGPVKLTDSDRVFVGTVVGMNRSAMISSR